MTYAKWGEVDMFKQAMGRHAMKGRVVDSAASIDGQREYDLYEVQPE